VGLYKERPILKTLGLPYDRIPEQLRKAHIGPFSTSSLLKRGSRPPAPERRITLSNLAREGPFLGLSRGEWYPGTPLFSHIIGFILHRKTPRGSASPRGHGNDLRSARSTNEQSKIQDFLKSVRVMRQASPHSFSLLTASTKSSSLSDFSELSSK